ncbi:MAG: hypothetical protein GC192_20200 [Bacteroidetes bacterium]|nr:hypothetical protein [Bacteroidota bacterium]
MKRISLIAILTGVIFCSGNGDLLSQSTSSVKFPLKQDIPTVFLLGELDKRYDEMMADQSTLLDACNDDMNLAYSKLMGMMQEMEAYAELVDFDLKGINAWIHFFWRADGSLEHIGFYLKPNSRNVSTELMKNFLEGFAKQYRLPLKYSKKFSHYASFAFPIVRNISNPENAKNTAKANTRSSN